VTNLAVHVEEDVSGLIDYGQDEQGRHFGYLYGPYKNPVVELEGIGEMENGDFVGVGKDGSVYDVHPKLRETMFKEEISEMGLGTEAELGLGVGGERLGRAMGVGLGFLNIPYAAFWGGLNALAQDEGFMKGAFDSALRSLWKEGDWGETFGENVEIVTGKTVEENVLDLAAGTTDPGAKANLSRSAKLIAKISEPVMELLIGAALDVGTIAAALGHLNRGIKSGRLAAESVKELEALMKNRQDLVSVLEALKRTKTLQEARDGIKNRVSAKIAQQQKEKTQLAAQLKADRLRMRAKPGTVLAEREPFHKQFVGGLAELEGEIQQQAARSMQESLSSWQGGRDTLRNVNEVRVRNGLDPYTNSPDSIVKSPVTPAPVKSNTILEADLQTKQDVFQQALDDFATATEEIAALSKEAQAARASEEYPELLQALKGALQRQGTPQAMDALRKIEGRGFTADFLGMQQMWEGLSKLFPGAKGMETSVDDALELVEDVLRTQYGGLYNRNPTQVLKEEARLQGHRLGHFKKKKRWVLRKEDGTIQNFTNRDEVSKFLGLGDDAEEYAKFYNDFHIGLAAEDGSKAFVKWAFPEGLDGVTGEQILKAADKLEKMSKSRSKAFLMGDDWIKTAEGVLGRSPSGKQFFELMLGTRNAAERGFANAYLDFSKTLERYKGIDLEDLRLALDGHIDLASKNAQNAAADLRPTLDKVYKQAEKAGVKVAKYREGYFPHRIFDVDELRSGASRTMVLEASVKEGHFKNLSEATDALDGYIARMDGNKSDFRFIDWLAKKQNIPRSKALRLWQDTIAPQHNRVTGHLTKSRTANVPWYDRDLNSAIGHYMLEAHKGIENVGRLGRNKEVAYKLIDRIEAEGGNWKIADELLQRYTNPAQFQHTSDLAQKILTFNVVTKLNPLTTLVNMSQTMATTLRTSPRATMKAILGWDKEFAVRSGAIVNQTMRDIMAAHGAGSKWGGWYMRAIGFKKSEEILRTMASNAGRHHAMDLVEMLSKGKRTSYAKRQLASLGLDPDEIAKRGRLTTEELQEVGKRVSQQTQFRGDKFDLPMAWLGNYGRVVTQFKTFVYNQARLLNRAVWQEAKQGNLRPLMFLMTAYPAAGTGFDIAVNQMLLGKKPPESVVQAYFRGLTAVGGLGLLQTSLESMRYGAKATFETITGPGISDAVRLSSGISQIVLGGKDPVPMTMKALGSRTPFVGRLVGTALRQEQERGRGARQVRTAR
jgi:hypothetical protein